MGVRAKRWRKRRAIEEARAARRVRDALGIARSSSEFAAEAMRREKEWKDAWARQCEINAQLCERLQLLSR